MILTIKINLGLGLNTVRARSGLLVGIYMNTPDIYYTICVNASYIIICTVFVTINTMIKLT